MFGSSFWSNNFWSSNYWREIARENFGEGSGSRQLEQDDEEIFTIITSTFKFMINEDIYD